MLSWLDYISMSLQNRRAMKVFEFHNIQSKKVCLGDQGDVLCESIVLQTAVMEQPYRKT